MRAGIVLAALILALLPELALAKDETVKTGPKPAWAQLSDPLPVPDEVRGPVFVRRNNIQIHLDKSSQMAFFGSLIRVLDTNALALGNVSISWNPAAGSPIVHAVRVHRSGVARDVLAETKFEVLRREDQLEAAMLDGVLTAVVRVPDLRVGDEIELSYTVPSHDPTLRTSSYGFLFLDGNPPPGRMSLRLSWEAGEEPLLRQTQDIADALTRNAQSVSATFDNAAALNPPKEAPPRYLWQRALEYSDFADWPALSRRMVPLFEAAAELPATSAVRTEGAAIAAAHPAQLDRAAAALKLVQQQVRYIYVGLNGGNLTPAKAEETWQRRYGDCKGKTALLLALLKELGIEAEAVLVNNSGGDDGIDARLPSPGMFDHVLVRATIDGKTYWLDGTLPPVYRPSETAILPYRWVLPLSPEGSVLEKIVWKPDAKPSLTWVVDIDSRQGFSVPAKLTTTIIRRGRAALAEHVQLSSVTDSQLETSIRETLEGSETWTTVEKVTWRFDVAEQASVMQITGTGPVDWSNENGKSKYLTLPGGGFNPPRRRARGSGQDAAAPYYIEPEFDCRVTTLRLPSGTEEKDWSYNTGFDRVLFGQTFRRSFERRDGAIRMIRSNRTLQTELSSAEATQDNAQIADFDNSMARAFYDPGSYDSNKRTELVPAADEVDWVKDPSACLAPQPVGK
jgi:transglutaminase-like putative cysteine protease